MVAHRMPLFISALVDFVPFGLRYVGFGEHGS